MAPMVMKLGENEGAEGGGSVGKYFKGAGFSGYSQNRGMKDQDLSPIQVLQNNKLPSILIEAGFLASENDRLYLIDDAKRKVFADKIADGIIKTLEDEKKSNSNP